MKIVIKLAPPPPPPRDYMADEICAAESLLMLSQSTFPLPLSSSNPPAATKSTPAPTVKITQDWSPLPPLSSNFPHTCDVCGDAFKSPQALGGHKTRHRPKPTTGAAALKVSGGNDRVHECSICQERFSTGQALGGHKRKHFEGIIGGPSKSVKTSSSGSPGRDSSGVVVIEDDGPSHASTKLLDLDLNLPYTHNFFE